MPITLTPAQRAALLFVLDKGIEQGECLIDDAPGLGKTTIFTAHIGVAVWRFEHLHPEGIEDRPQLVAVPNNLVTQYGKSEQPGLGPLSCPEEAKLDPSRKQYPFKPVSGHALMRNVLVVSYLNVSRLDNQHRDGARADMFSYAYCDEAHELRFGEERRHGRWFCGLKPFALFLFTATPIVHNLQDIRGYIAMLEQPWMSADVSLNETRGTAQEIARYKAWKVVRNAWIQDDKVPDGPVAGKEPTWLYDTSTAPQWVPQVANPIDGVHLRPGITEADRDKVARKVKDSPINEYWQVAKRRPSMARTERYTETKVDLNVLTPAEQKARASEKKKKRDPSTPVDAPFNGMPIFELHNPHNQDKYHCLTTKGWNYWVGRHLDMIASDPTKHANKNIAFRRVGIVLQDIMLAREHSSTMTDTNGESIVVTPGNGELKMERVNLKLGEEARKLYLSVSAKVVESMQYDFSVTMENKGERHPVLLQGESRAAVFARLLEYSLVIVQFDAANEDVWTRDGPGAPFTTRWSVGNNCELALPLYIGFGCGRAFSLRLRDPDQYLRWTASTYDWQDKHDTLVAQYGLFLNLDGFIQVAVRLQRLVRAGYRLKQSDLAPLITPYALVLLHNQCNFAFLAQETFMAGDGEQTTNATDPVLSFEWITHAIACSENALAKEVAFAYDVAEGMEEAQYPVGYLPSGQYTELCRPQLDNFLLPGVAVPQATPIRGGGSQAISVSGGGSLAASSLPAKGTYSSPSTRSAHGKGRGTPPPVVDPATPGTQHAAVQSVANERRLVQHASPVPATAFSPTDKCASLALPAAASRISGQSAQRRSPLPGKATRPPHQSAQRQMPPPGRNDGRPPRLSAQSRLPPPTGASRPSTQRTQRPLPAHASIAGPDPPRESANDPRPTALAEDLPQISRRSLATVPTSDHLAVAPTVNMPASDMSAADATLLSEAGAFSQSLDVQMDELTDLLASLSSAMPHKRVVITCQANSLKQQIKAMLVARLDTNRRLHVTSDALKKALQAEKQGIEGLLPCEMLN